MCSFLSAALEPYTPRTSTTTTAERFDSSAAACFVAIYSPPATENFTVVSSSRSRSSLLTHLHLVGVLYLVLRRTETVPLLPRLSHARVQGSREPWSPCSLPGRVVTIYNTSSKIKAARHGFLSCILFRLALVIFQDPTFCTSRNENHPGFQSLHAVYVTFTNLLTHQKGEKI